jgi:membrane-associated phospholipid phosphatase
MRRRARPLLRDARRTRAWPVLATCVLVIAALGLLLRAQAHPDRLDSVVDTAMVASFRSHQGVLPWLALPGSTVPLIAVSLAIAVGCLVARRPNGVILAVTAVPVTAFLGDTVLKHLVDRTHSGQLSFPSGHTASAMTLATVLGVLLHGPARRTAARMARAALVVVACAVTALRSRASALLSRRRPTSRYRSATAGRRAPARESPPGAGHAATGTRVARLPRLHLPARQHARP